MTTLGSGQSTGEFSPLPLRGPVPPDDEDVWEELPGRPLRKKLGPFSIVLCACLLAGGFFYAGVRVEKSKVGSSSGGGSRRRRSSPRGGVCRHRHRRRGHNRGRWRSRGRMARRGRPQPAGTPAPAGGGGRSAAAAGGIRRRGGRRPRDDRADRRGRTCICERPTRTVVKVVDQRGDDDLGDEHGHGRQPPSR